VLFSDFFKILRSRETLTGPRPKGGFTRCLIFDYFTVSVFWPHFSVSHGTILIPTFGNFCGRLSIYKSWHFLLQFRSGVNFTNIFARLFFKNKLRSFFGWMANGAQIWQTSHRFGKFLIDFSIQSGESIVGEIERQFLKTMWADNFSLV